MHYSALGTHKTWRSGKDVEWWANHNGDMSGDVWLSARAGDIVTAEEDINGEDITTVYIPFAVMVELVGNFIRDSRIGALEQVTGTEMVEGIAGEAIPRE